jgi:DNA-binding NarL/FixJ family response regulator
MPATAYVVDDHAGFRVAARALLQSVGYQVVGVAADGPTALRDLRRTPVDLALVDLYLPGEDGVDLTDRIVAEGGATAVFIVSSREDAGTDPRVVASAATGFIAKRDLSASRLRGLLP